MKFKPDSPELLPEESSRLDDIALVLKQAPDSMFLVEGHTARVGDAGGEQLLSEQRAEAVARALAERGVPLEKFICRGYGGSRPVADNATKEGRALNRRVEITVLE